jgi:xyloglucan-specific endo-beta-1,4-glucanase
MKLTTIMTLAASASLTLATPTPTLQKSADYCGQWDSAVTGTYTVYNVCFSFPLILFPDN